MIAAEIGEGVDPVLTDGQPVRDADLIAHTCPQRGQGHKFMLADCLQSHPSLSSAEPRQTLSDPPPSPQPNRPRFSGLRFDFLPPAM